ncbi:YitT family protein [Oscillibacter sp.]|jgi:uncharacterized membrane protein YczE|uniref:YczE/YyaS/YitT family protein n=1 Tax=Oscillibacter sp. TaxID=1945593 RepID=UPI002172943F|nr:hypothetical protein [Oscillibacter sp.]MCI9650110.1 hypothetical protein [Oscillibacter sp.]
MSANLRDLAGRLIRPRMGRRLAALTLSLMVIGACVAVFKTVGFGTDPCSTFTLGVSAHTGVSFGTCQLLFNLLMFIPVFRYDVSRIGIGTIGNMVGIGYIADLCMELMRPLIPAEGLSMTVRVVMFALSMAGFLIAAAFYMVVDLGVAPYDAIPQLIAARAKRWSYRRVRMLWDISILSAGFLLGSTVGMTTVITGFCLGPVIVFFSDRVSGWFA